MRTHLQVIYIGLAALTLSATYALQCFSCHGVNDTSACIAKVECAASQACYHRKQNVPSGENVDMGCLDSAFCTNIGGIIGRSVPQSRGSVCTECCSTDYCNDQLCYHSQPSDCVDDETVDCARLSSLFNICTGDYEHAALVCPRFCSLCNYKNGHWAEWSPWSSCSITCGNATLTRTRTCTNPPPSSHGKPCPGASLDFMSCVRSPCPVDGGWGSWTQWSSCTTTCGIGLQNRDRACDNPPPKLFGDHCFGSSVDFRTCLTRACSDGGWSTWSLWSSCSATCGGGLHIRSRECSNPAPSPYGQPCHGPNVDSGLCSTQQCPQDGNVNIGYWSTWTAWSTCSSTCPGGERTRQRYCSNGVGCVGNDQQSMSCNNGNACVRLTSGRLEINIYGEWGTVCDDNFDTNAAQVACRMLGQSTSNALVIQPPAGLSVMPILLDDVICNGRESSLLQCTHLPIGHNNCGHGEDVGVSC
ncbi:coadhesin-like [Dreissena polymorpha]|nr:coadhesin-like [Dreissena polymorpha]